MQSSKPHERERGWRHSLRAIFILTLFGICTIIGYIIYEMALQGAAPQFLVVNTFFWMLVFYSILPINRSIILTFRTSISQYTIYYAMAQFAYWYAFWVGLAAMQSATLALAILALTAVATPVAVRTLEKKGERSSIRGIFFVGLLIILAIVLIKLDLKWEKFTVPEVMTAFAQLGWYPIICMGLAVIAEAVSDRTVYQLANFVETNNTYFIEEYNWWFKLLQPQRGGVNEITIEKKKEIIADISGKEMKLQAIPICFALSLIMTIIHGEWSWKYITLNAHWGWTFLFMALLGLIGSSARLIFINPLLSQQLDTRTLPPLMAGRQALFLAIAYITIQAALFFGVDAQRAENTGCYLTRWRTSPEVVNLNILPCGNFSYWVGLGIVGLIWLLSWIYFFKIGFFKNKFSKDAKNIP